MSWERMSVGVTDDRGCAHLVIELVPTVVEVHERLQGGECIGQSVAGGPFDDVDELAHAVALDELGRELGLLRNASGCRQTKRKAWSTPAGSLGVKMWPS